MTGQELIKLALACGAEVVETAFGTVTKFRHLDELAAFRTNGGEAVAWWVQASGETTPLSSHDLFDNQADAEEYAAKQDYNCQVTPLKLASPVSIPREGTSGVRVTDEMVDVVREIYARKVREYDRDFEREMLPGEWEAKYGTNLHSTSLGEKWGDARCSRCSLGALAMTSTAEIIAEFRHACAASGPCSDNGDGCTCTDSELAIRNFKANLGTAKAATSLASKDATIERLEGMFFWPDAKRRVWWIGQRIESEGRINRADICGAFGVSVPQASADMGEYMRQNPDAVTYDKSAKCYILARSRAGGAR